MAGKVDINYVYDRYIVTRDDLRDSTWSNYKFHYDKHVRDGFGKRKIGSVVHSDVVAYYGLLFTERNLSLYTVRTIHNILSMTLETAVNDRVIRMNPVKGALTESRRRAKKTGGTRNALTLEEQNIFTSILEQPENRYWKPIFIVLLGTGMRVGELAGLRWEDVNLDEELNAVREGRDPLYLPNFSCHVLRHTFCTRLCEVETNLKSIQKIMGHSDIKTTLNIYADVMESAKRESLEKLSDYFNGKGSDGEVDTINE